MDRTSTDTHHRCHRPRHDGAVHRAGHASDGSWRISLCGSDFAQRRGRLRIDQFSETRSRRLASRRGGCHFGGATAPHPSEFEDFTIYANAEHCALCCYVMRETRIGRVVFGVPAPLTGGVTRWNILTDTKLSDTVPQVFAPPPQIVPGFMREQIESAIASRAPLAWEVIRARNIFGGPLPAVTLTRAVPQRSRGFRQQFMSFLRRRLFDYFGRK